MIGTLDICLRHVIALSNTIYRNIKPVFPVISNAVEKREHLH